MTERPDPQSIARRIAAFGLPRDDGGSIPPLIEDGAWDQVLSLLAGNRTTGFALAAAETGWLAISPEQAEALLEAHRGAMLSPLAVERGLLEIAAAFEDETVEFVILKGPALAHTVYPDPSWRFFGDLDLLVRGQDWRKASGILEGLGYHRGLPEPRSGFDERFGKASEFRRPAGIEVDLHRTLVVGPFGLWIEPEILFGGTTELRLWNRTLKRFDDTLLQLHACMHASLGWWPPLQVPVRDVAQVAHYGQVDWDALAEWAARWKLRAVVSHALQTAVEMLGVSLPAGASSAMGRTSSRLERRALESYVSTRRDEGGTALGTLRAIRGIRARVAYLRALLFPNREFLAVRTGSARPSYLRRWAVPIRWLRRRVKS